MSKAVQKFGDLSQPVNISESLLQRFWSKVKKADNGCWEWTGNKASWGYGSIYTSRREMTRSHRLSYYIKHGPIPRGLWVLHRCDNPPCVNPDHLWLGTRNDNVTDMVEKRRHSHGEPHKERARIHSAKGDRNGLKKNPHKAARGDRHGTKTHPECLKRGEANCWAKLTEEKVRALFSRKSKKLGAIRDASLEFGVSRTVVCKIWSGKKWRHLKLLETEATSGPV